MPSSKRRKALKATFAGEDSSEAWARRSRYGIAKGIDMRRILAILLVTVVLSGLGLTFRAAPGSAAGIVLLPSQYCVGGKVDVFVGWQGADPRAKEFWIDLGSDVAFSANSFSSYGPISGRAANYTLKGLEPHTLNYIRLNQQLPSGTWEYGQPLRVPTACGTALPAAGASFTVVGYADHIMANFGPPADVTVPGDTLVGCKANQIFLFMNIDLPRTEGAPDFTDVLVTWTPPAEVKAPPTAAWSFPAGPGKPFFLLRPQGGTNLVTGTYSFKLQSGPEDNRQTNVETSLEVKC